MLKMLGPSVSGLFMWKGYDPRISPMTSFVLSTHFPLLVIVPTFVNLGGKKNMTSQDYDMDTIYFQPCWKITSKCPSESTLLVPEATFK
jgi:hypothetical protein